LQYCELIFQLDSQNSLSRKSSSRCSYEIVLNWINPIRECPLMWVYWTDAAVSDENVRAQRLNTFDAASKGRAEICGKITTRILPHSMVTRVTFIEFTPARGGLLYLIKADVYSYVHSIPFPRAYPDPASLSSYRCASVALFTYYWCAACRQQAIEIPSLSIGHPPSLSLFAVLCKGRNAFPVSPLTKISIWHAANRTAQLRRALFSNSIEWNRGIAWYKIRSKYNRG